MPAPPKYILHSPILDECRLKAFVEQCLAENASLIAIFGLGCAELEDVVDALIVGDGSDSGRFICTTSHPDETLEDVRSFVAEWEQNEGGEVHEARF